MSEVEQPMQLPAAVVEVVLRAAGRSGPFSPEEIEAFSPWLSDKLERAIRRARRTPLTQRDVDRLERAYRRFHDTIESLQDRDEPPPLIRMSDGATDWDHWIGGVSAFGFKQGRRVGSDWRLIAELLALYEIGSKRVASAAQSRGPTMRFLGAALDELATQVPFEERSYFAAPTSGALKARLRRLRRTIVKVKNELAETDRRGEAKA